VGLIKVGDGLPLRYYPMHTCVRVRVPTRSMSFIQVVYSNSWPRFMSLKIIVPCGS
jgi:hypothetical protein